MSRRVDSDSGRTLLDRAAARVAPAFAELGGPGSFVAPLVMVAGASLCSAAALHPLVGAAFAGQPDGVGASVQVGLWMVALASPVLALVKGMILGGVAWSVLVLLRATPLWGATVSALLYGEAILAGHGIWLALAGHAKGPGSITTPTDLQVVSGLDAFITATTPAGAAFIQGFSAFHMAWVGFLGLALAAVARTSKPRGYTAAAVVWCLVVGFTVIRARAL